MKRDNFDWDEFHKFLERVSAEVARWPDWKRNVTLDGRVIDAHHKHDASASLICSNAASRSSSNKAPS